MFRIDGAAEHDDPVHMGRCMDDRRKTIFQRKQQPLVQRKQEEDQETAEHSRDEGEAKTVAAFPDAQEADPAEQEQQCARPQNGPENFRDDEIHLASTLGINCYRPDCSRRRSGASGLRQDQKESAVMISSRSPKTLLIACEGVQRGFCDT